MSYTSGYLINGNNATITEQLTISNLNDGGISIMSELRTNRIVPRDGLPSGSAGGIIQVKQTIKRITSITSNVSSAVTQMSTGYECYNNTHKI